MAGVGFYGGEDFLQGGFIEPLACEAQAHRTDGGFFFERGDGACRGSDGFVAAGDACVDRNGVAGDKEGGVFGEGFIPRGDFERAGEVFEDEDAKRFSVFFGKALFDGHDQARELECAGLGGLARLRDGVVFSGVEIPRVAVERVSAHIVAEQFLLVFERIQIAPRLDLGGIGGFFRRCERRVAEERELSARAVALERGGGGHGGFDLGEESGAVFVQAVEGAAFDKALENFAVHRAGIEARTEILQRAEGAAFFPFGNGGFHRACADIFDGCQPEANARAVGLGGEFQHAGVDIRRQHGNLHASALGDHHGETVGIVGIEGEHGGHELTRKMGLQVGGLVGNPAIRGAVGFVESVLGEFLDKPEDGVGHFGWDVVVRAAALDEAFALLLHLFGVLFPHRAAEQVGLAE